MPPLKELSMYFFQFHDVVLIIPRYLLRTPAQWDPETSPRPIVFLHGLGFGLLHYHPFILHLFTEFSDRPVLVPLQPQSSHDFFHPDYLNPPDRKSMSNRLARLIQFLGWAGLENRKTAEEVLDENDEIRSILLSDSQRGVTIVSHSKFVVSSEYLRVGDIHSVYEFQWFVYPCLDVERIPIYRWSFMFC